METLLIVKCPGRDVFRLLFKTVLLIIVIFYTFPPHYLADSPSIMFKFVVQYKSFILAELSRLEVDTKGLSEVRRTASSEISCGA